MGVPQSKWLGWLSLVSGLTLLILLILPSISSATNPSLRTDGGSPQERGALRVCADPNNLPFSSRDETGFENRMAELLAEELDLPVKYTWYPQRFGYIRATLRKWLDEEQRYRCDVLMGAPLDASGLSTTTPYYHSTYVLVYVKGRGLDNVKQPSDLHTLDPAVRAQLRIAAYDQSPATDWLIRHGLRQNIKGYVLTDGDVSFNAGKIIEEDLAQGNVDAAILWGPIGGYFASKASEEMVVLPMKSEHQVRFDFAISVGVRAGDHDLLRPLQMALRDNRDAIQELLEEYEIPVVEVQDPRLAQ